MFTIYSRFIHVLLTTHNPGRWYTIYNENRKGWSTKMQSLFDYVLKTAALFRKCDRYSQSAILKEECAELIVALSHFERNRTGSLIEVLEELSHVLISCCAFIICANIPVNALIVEVTKKYKKYHLESEIKNNDSTRNKSRQL